MKSNRLFLLMLCTLVVSGGCKYPVVYYVAPPSVDQMEVYAAKGKEIRWVATGKPFRVTFGHYPKPCIEEEKDLVNTTGKGVLICHLLSGKPDADFMFYIEPYDPKNPKTPAPEPTTKPIPARVGTCNGCMPTGGTKSGGTATGQEDQTVAKNEGQTTSTSSPVSSTPIDISCDSKNNTAWVDPQSATVNKGQAVYWKYIGYPPQSGHAFEVTIPAGLCSNLPAGTIVSDQNVQCTAVATQSYSYTVNSCGPPAVNGNITVQ